MDCVHASRTRYELNMNPSPTRPFSPLDKSLSLKSGNEVEEHGSFATRLINRERAREDCENPETTIGLKRRFTIHDYVYALSLIVHYG